MWTKLTRKKWAAELRYISEIRERTLRLICFLMVPIFWLKHSKHRAFLFADPSACVCSPTKKSCRWKATDRLPSHSSPPGWRGAKAWVFRAGRQGITSQRCCSPVISSRQNEASSSPCLDSNGRFQLQKAANHLLLHCRQTMPCSYFRHCSRKACTKCLSQPGCIFERAPLVLVSWCRCLCDITLSEHTRIAQYALQNCNLSMTKVATVFFKAVTFSFHARLLGLWKFQGKHVCSAVQKVQYNLLNNFHFRASFRLFSKEQMWHCAKTTWLHFYRFPMLEISENNSTWKVTQCAEKKVAHLLF